MKILISLVIFLSLLSCKKEKCSFTSPPNYDFNNPEIYKMPETLLEISGHAFHKGQKDTIYAQQDERGVVYTMVLGTDYLRTSLFKKHGDFEDIAIANETVMMLKSNGKLYTFPFKDLKNKEIKSYKRWKNIVPKGEYESLYADDTSDRIYVLCKDCKVDKGKAQVSGYIFDFKVGKKPKPAGEFRINSNEIARLMKKESIKFKPSALTYNRQKNEWYILSSVNKILVITDPDWNVKKVYHLDPSIYIQPEGIAFDNEHNLYISSEGSKLRMGRIFKLAYSGENTEE